MGEQWRETLRQHRKRLAISRAELARRASFSVETVRAYEEGKRHPRRESLDALLQALNVPLAEANQVLEAAGFAPVRTVFPLSEHPEYYYRVDELQNVVEQVPWPEFVLNDNLEVVAANAAVQKLWRIDYEAEAARRAPAQMSLLSVANAQRFTEHVLNWEECVGVIASVFKAHPRHNADIDAPGPYLNAVLAELATGDPAFLRRIATVWEQAPPREAKCRWSYRVFWRDEEYGEIRFLAIVSTRVNPMALASTVGTRWMPPVGTCWSG